MEQMSPCGRDYPVDARTAPRTERVHAWRNALKGRLCAMMPDIHREFRINRRLRVEPRVFHRPRAIIRRVISR